MRPMRSQLIRLMMETEIWIPCGVTHLPATISQILLRVQSSPSQFCYSSTNTSAYSWKEVSTTLGYSATSNALSQCEDEKAGLGVGNIIEIDCVLRSFGLAAGAGQYTAVQLISNADSRERRPEYKLQKVRKWNIALSLIVAPISLAHLPFPACQL